MACFGPITKLNLLSTFCPCLLSDNDKMAASSCTTLNGILSKGIILHKPNTETNSDSNGAGGGFSMGNFLGGSSSSVTKIKSRARVTDGPLGKSPIIEITPDNDDGGTKTEGDEEMNPLFRQSNRVSVSLSKISKFALVSTPSSVSNWVSKSLTGSSKNAGSGRLLVIYSRLNDNEEIARLEVKDEDDVIEYFNILVEWDRTRRKNEGIEDDDEDDDITDTQQSEMEQGGVGTAAATGGTNNTAAPQKKGFLKTQAEKAAHFAKRELEMREMRREREQRKAKYLKEAGGLKYTAMAMAREG